MSRLRIFETDPDAKPKPRFVDDTVGRFRSGMMDGKQPVSLDTWRVTTGDPEVAETIAATLGGTPQEWETTGEDSTEIVTDASTVRVIIDGPEAIESDLKLWANGHILHHCDGVEFLSPDEDAGQPCGCPEAFAERKARAKAGRGPKPDTRITFRLADNPDLGKFRMGSGSWDLVKVLHVYENDLEDVGGHAICDLVLAEVSFEIKKGPRAGLTVSYKRPELKIIGAA